MSAAPPTSLKHIDPPWLSSDGVAKTMAALSAAGATPRFVGGCVRNALIAAGPTDLDIAIDVPPDETTRLLKAASLRAIPTGIEHGTVTTLAEIDGRDEPIEITSLRRDVETDGRRAVVAFTSDWREDAERRDFTMNALYADADGQVFDPLGDGVTDLEARRVRFIGDPVARIREDYLRILRYFRFIAWYGDGPREDADLAAIETLRDGLGALAPERIGAELKKLLSAPIPTEATALMAEVGVLGMAIPPARQADSGVILAGLIDAEIAYGLPPNGPHGAWPRRLTALIEPETDARALAKALRFSNAEGNALAARMASSGLTPGEVAYRYGAEVAWDAAAIDAAFNRPRELASLKEGITTGASAEFPLKASDLIAAGAKSGPTLGAALKDAERDWIHHNFALDREALLVEALKKV